MVKSSKRTGEAVSDEAVGRVFCLLAMPVVMVSWPLGCLNVHELLEARQGKRLAPVAVFVPRLGSDVSRSELLGSYALQTTHVVVMTPGNSKKRHSNFSSA